MLDKTGNIVLVEKMLGHRSVTTTQRYLHPELKEIANLVTYATKTTRTRFYVIVCVIVLGRRSRERQLSC
jgi:integrase